jgi:hypothetical protein
MWSGRGLSLSGNPAVLKSIARADAFFNIRAARAAEKRSKTHAIYLAKRVYLVYNISKREQI